MAVSMVLVGFEGGVGIGIVVVVSWGSVGVVSRSGVAWRGILHIVVAVIVIGSTSHIPTLDPLVVSLLPTINPPFSFSRYYFDITSHPPPSLSVLPGAMFIE